MAKVQGDFANSGAAHQAKDALMQAGIAENRIRVWNILPGSGSESRSGSAVTTGAVVGGLLGGGGGLVAGAALGSLLDSGNETESPLPEPSGARVVVDVAGDQEQLETRLREAGAANVHVIEAN